MRRVATAAGILLCQALSGIAAQQVPPDLRDAMRARHEAVCRIDTVTWARLTADGFTMVGPDGKLRTKAERVAQLTTEKPRPVPAIQQERLQHYGDTVVRRFLDDNEWILEIWVRQDGAWRVVAAQVNFAK
jgi:Domain of unknown function (DUF4440)